MLVLKILNSTLFCLALARGKKFWVVSNRTICILFASAAVFLTFMALFNLSYLQLYPSKMLYCLLQGALSLQGLLSIHRFSRTSPSSFNFMLGATIMMVVSFNLLIYLHVSETQTLIGKMVVTALNLSGQFFMMHGCLHH